MRYQSDNPRLGNPHILARQSASPPTMPNPPTIWNRAHPRSLRSSVHHTTPRGSCGLSRLMRYSISRPLGAPVLGGEMSSPLNHGVWVMGTREPSTTHSLSRSVSQTARSPLAIAAYRSRSFWRLCCKSAAHLTSRTCAIFSSR